MRARKGFTLIELLIVITIIGILSGGLFLTMRNTTAKAEAVKIVSDLRSLELASALYYSEHIESDNSPQIGDLKNYITTPGQLEKNSRFDIISDSKNGKCYVGYKVNQTTAGDKKTLLAEAVRKHLAGMAEKHALLCTPSGNGEDPQIYDGSENGVYIRIR